MHIMRLQKKRLLLVILAGTALVGLAFWRFNHQAGQVASAQASAQQAPGQQTEALTIPAIRARHYSASPIRTVRNLGGQGGYSTAVISFTSDGLKEYALQATPDSRPPAGGYPVIILMHGYFPPETYRTTQSFYADFLAAWSRAGFVVIQPDERGNDKSQGTAVSGYFSPDYTYDMLNLIASLKQYKLVNSQRLGIFGHSMGGHVALNVAVCSPDVKATVLVNGVVGSMYDIFYNWPNSPAPHDHPNNVVKAEIQTLQKERGTPKTNPTFYNEASAINYTTFIKGPVQIDHDTADSIVPFYFSQHLYNSLLETGKNATFYQYQGNDHGMNNPANRNLIIQRSTQFFEQYL